MTSAIFVSFIYIFLTIKQLPVKIYSGVLTSAANLLLSKTPGEGGNPLKSTIVANLLLKSTISLVGYFQVTKAREQVHKEKYRGC